MKHIISIILCLALICLSFGGCYDSNDLDDASSSGYSNGYDAGLEEGRELGYEDGYQEAQDEFGNSYQDGYDSGHEDGYEEGYEDGIADTESSIGFLLKSLEQPYPESGTVHNATTETRPTTMNITNDTKCAYFCKVVSEEDNGHYMEFFMRPDSSASVTLPLGTYYIFYQRGTGLWHGWDARFWKSCETGMFFYYYVSNGGTYEIITSDEQTKEIDEDDFQQLQKPSEVATPSQMVWIPKISGNKYHSIDTCCNMYDPYYVSIEWAQAKGYTACSNCW